MLKPNALIGGWRYCTSHWDVWADYKKKSQKKCFCWVGATDAKKQITAKTVLFKRASFPSTNTSTCFTFTFMAVSVHWANKQSNYSKSTDEKSSVQNKISLYDILYVLARKWILIICFHSLHDISHQSMAAGLKANTPAGFDVPLCNITKALVLWIFKGCILIGYKRWDSCM